MLASFCRLRPAGRRPVLDPAVPGPVGSPLLAPGFPLGPVNAGQNSECAHNPKERRHQYQGNPKLSAHNLILSLHCLKQQLPLMPDRADPFLHHTQFPYGGQDVLRRDRKQRGVGLMGEGIPPPQLRPRQHHVRSGGRTPNFRRGRSEQHY